MSSDDTEWQEQRLARTEALIIAIEDAIETLSGGALSYTIDTGQTRQTVTRSEIGSLENRLHRLENRRAILRTQLGCGGQTRVIPGF